MRRLKRSFARIAMVATVAGALLTGSPAGATEPVGGCAPPFEEPILIEDLALPVLVEFAQAIDTATGANRDGYVCFMPLATGNQTGWLQLVNILDNRIP